MLPVLGDRLINMINESSPWNQQNREFWDEACGSTFAMERNIDLRDLANLAKFDDAYHSFYPYLKEELDWVLGDSKRVIEVGLGLGTTSRYVAKRVPDYVGLDIAAGPCSFTQMSFDHYNLVGKVVCGSILDDSLVRDLGLFDSAIAIGSLHHTGDLDRALKNLEGIVKPGGRILVMVYYSFMPKRILMQPYKTFKEFRHSVSRSNSQFSWLEMNSNMRGHSDKNSAGVEAPITAYTSRKFFSARNRVSYKTRLRNSHRIKIWRYEIPRNIVLKTISWLIGVTIYARGEKL
jgi:SAM-dependent methyltransferase